MNPIEERINKDEDIVNADKKTMDMENKGIFIDRAANEHRYLFKIES